MSRGWIATWRSGMRRRLGRAPGAAALGRFHRDERGEMLEYVMVLAFIAVPLFFIFEKLFQVLSDYFSMIAFYVTWPFI